MTSTHICIVSDQSLPNILPLLYEQPELVIFLASPEMYTMAERLKKIVQPHGISVEIEQISSAYDFDIISAACEAVVSRKQNESELVLNVTGGTKIAALAAFQTFFFATGEHRVIYLDSSNNVLLELSPRQKKMPLTENIIRVRECLLAYGMNVIALEAANDVNHRRGLEELATLLLDCSELLHRLNSALAKQQKKGYANLTLNELGEEAEVLAALLERCGVAGFTGRNTMNIPSKEAIFFCMGGWLEEYVFWCVKNMNIKGLDVAMNVRVEWAGKGRHSTRNEFDVVFTHGNRLHLISCKTADPDRHREKRTKAVEALNELDALTERAGGIFARAMLVSAHPLRDVDRERAQKMGIELVDKKGVLDLRNRLLNWVS